MRAHRSSRPVLTALLGVGVAAAVLASGSSPAAGAASPLPRPESVAPADPTGRAAAPHPGQLVLRAGDTRTIPDRLVAAGADPALGSRVSAVVLDAANGHVIYSRNPTLALMPASNEKLVTAFVALSSMPPTTTFGTHVRTNSTRSTVWLVGGGDPALSLASLRTMASRTRDSLVRSGRSSVAVRVSDSLFPAPTNATGWKTSYVPGDVAPVRPLVAGGRNVMDTGMDAGVIFANELTRLGISVTSTSRSAVPADAQGLTRSISPPMGSIVAQLINVSSNDFAENAHRQSSLRAGRGATWSGAGAHALATLQARGVTTSGVAIHDGSGLSRSNRQSATTLASLLLQVSRTPAVHEVLYSPGGMPTAGVSGTLRTRFAASDTVCARGKVRAKTGWLSDVVALSGTAYGVDGRQRIFSIIENGAPDPTAARLAIERFATAATGCNPA